MFADKMSRLSFSVTVLALVGLVTSQCPAGRSISLCCQSLEPFSDNEYVWENICSISVSDTSLLVGSDCDEGSWYTVIFLCSSLILLCSLSAPTLEGFYDTCCAVTYSPYRLLASFDSLRSFRPDYLT